MEQTLYKRRWIPFIFSSIFFLVLAMHDSAIFGQNYIKYFVRNYDRSFWNNYYSFFACGAGLIIFAALICSIYKKKILALIFSCLNTLFALLPILYCISTKFFPSLQLGYHISLTFVGVFLIAYNVTITKKFWKKAPLVIFILGIISVFITVILSFVSYDLWSGSIGSFSSSAWQNFGKPIIENYRYPVWWGIPVQLEPLIFSNPVGILGIEACSSLFPLSVGFLLFAVAAGLDVNRLKPVKYLTNSNDGYIAISKHILLCLLTGGIWSMIWIYRTTRLLNNVSEVEKYNPTSKLLLCMFVPFYQIYWFYKHGQRIDAYAKQKQISTSDMATLCLILGIFVPIVAVILMQDRINTICTATPNTEKLVIKQDMPQNNIDDLKKYKELLDQGVITQEEFDAKKKQLLGL